MKIMYECEKHTCFKDVIKEKQIFIDQSRTKLVKSETKE